MASSVQSVIDYSGTDSLPADVQRHITDGLPSINIIGYASKTVDEAKDRLRASFSTANP